MKKGDGESALGGDSLGLQNTRFIAAFLEIAFDAVVAFDARERITDWNPAAEQMFGWTAQEARGKTPAELFWPVNTPEEKKDRRQRQSRLKRGETLRGEHTSCRKDGASLRVQYAARAVFNAEEKVTGYLAIYRDNSAQEQILEKSREKEESLRARMEEIETLLEVSPVAIFVAHDPECARISGNPAGYRLVELPEDSNVSKSAPDQERPTYRVFRNGVEVSAEDLPMQRAARLGVEISEEALELRFEDGSQKFLYAFAKPLFDSQGQSRGAVAAMLDITERKRSEQLIRESEERFRNIFNQSPIGIGVYDADGVLVNLNQASMEMFGIPSLESVLGLELFSSPTVHAEAKLKLRNQEQIQEEVVYDFDEIRRLGFYETTRSGVSYFNRIITPLRSTSGVEPSGYLSQVLDITARKRAEAQLERSNQKLNDILASIQDDFYVIDRDWMFVYANRQFTSKLGKEPEDFVGNNVWTMFPKHVGMVLEENFRAAMEKRETRRFEIPGQYTDAWYSITAFPSPEGITVLGSDITEHKRLQAETESMAKFPQENPNPVLRVSQDGVVLFGNRASQKLLDHWNCSIGMPLPDIWREKVTERFRLGVAGEAMLEWNGRIFSLQLVPIIGRHYLNIYGRDITERKRAEEQLERSNQRLNEILASIQDDFYMLDHNWNFAYANRLFTSRVGKEPEDFVGHNIWKMFPKHRDTIVEENFRAAMEKREIRRFETRGKYTSAWYRLTVFPSAEGITVLGVDITKRKLAEDALRKSKKQLQLLNETLEQKVQEKTAEVHQLASDLVKAAQRERHRLSHILHDDLQQRIYSIRIQLTFLHDELQRENEGARREVSDIEKQLAEALEVTRNLSIDLSPPILRDEGLSHAIKWLAAQMGQRYGLPIELQANGVFALADEELHVLLFNCVRELLFNVVKHARASRAVVALQWSDAGLRIEVRDDGIGFQVAAPVQPGHGEMSEDNSVQSSSGLSTIRHQLRLFGGRMEIQSAPGAGTQIILTAPVAEAG